MKNKNEKQSLGTTAKPAQYLRGVPVCKVQNNPDKTKTNIPNKTQVVIISLP